MPLPELQTIAAPRFARAHDYAGVWAIAPEYGAMLWDRCQRTDLRAHVAASEAPKLRSDIQTVKVSGGTKEQTVAVVMITGPLMKALGSMDAGTSTVQARRDIRKAAADPDVSAILLAIDSPGGTVSGTADLAAEVAAAAKQKPTWAFIDDLGASAAYWVASQADRVFANTGTALVGSIGTLFVVYDLSGMAEKEGVKTLVFGTGPIKGAGTPGAPVTDEQQAYFKGLVDDMQKSFDAAVSKGRGLSAKQLADAKTGGVFPAAEALSRGLIDGIQSMDRTISDLATEARRQKSSQTTRAESPIPVRSDAVEETTPTVATTPAAPNATAANAMAATEIKAFREQFAAESERVAGVQRVAGKHPAIVAQAVREAWPVEKAELAALKADLKAHDVRPFNPAISVPGGPGGRPSFPQGVSVDDAIAAAVCTAIGNPTVEKRFKPDVLQAADDHFRGIGLQQILLMSAAQNGYHCRPGERVNTGNLKGVLKAAFQSDEMRAEGPSSISMSGILGNIANKELLTGYMEEDQSWREIAAVKSVNNFQQVTSYRMLDSMEYEEVSPAGKIKHGTAGQESYTRQAKTYAKMFALTRVDIVNDDLGAFADLRSRLGRGGAKKFNNLFWTKMLTDHATFFTAARTNYIEGATTNLGTDGVGLSLAIKAFRVMKSSAADGAKRVGGRPEILLVPPELEGNAEVTYRNQNLGSVKSSDANIHQNKYRPVVVPWLSDSEFTGYSTTAWYLFRNPADLPMMVASFLNGMQAPTVESADADFDTLGVQFRGYHDFGCDQAEYLAGVKSKGAA